LAEVTAVFSPPIMAAELMRTVAPATGTPAASRIVPARAEVELVWATSAVGTATSPSARRVRYPRDLCTVPPWLRNC